MKIVRSNKTVNYTIRKYIKQGYICLRFPVANITKSNAEQMIGLIQYRLYMENVADKMQVMVQVVNILSKGKVYLHNLPYTECVTNIYVFIHKHNINNIDYLSSVLSLQMCFELIS